MSFRPGAVATALRNLAVRLVHRHIALGAVVGVMAGLAAVGFYFATNAADFWVLGKLAGYHPPAERMASPGGMIESLHMGHRWFLFLLPALGG